MPAVGAGHTQRIPALVAECIACGILVLALRAFHGLPMLGAVGTTGSEIYQT